MTDWEDTVLATAATVADLLADAESSLENSAVVAGVVAVVLVAALAIAEDVPVDVLVVAAMQPVNTKRPATLTAPASLRARRAGCGRRRRVGVVLMIPPDDWYETSIGVSGKPHLGADQEPDKNSADAKDPLGRLLGFSQHSRIQVGQDAAMTNARARLR